MQQVDDYIDRLPENRKERVRALHDMILELYPQATVSMRYRVPTYMVGEGWVSIASQKSYISLYTCCPEHIRAFKERHPKIKSGKGCLNFRDSDELPMDDLKGVVRNAMEKVPEPVREVG